MSGTAFAKGQAVSPFEYVWGQAYHVLPETHNSESGYFSLCEGLNGKVYVGTAKYGVNSYLVEFDPKTEKQRIVIDTHKVCGLTAKGYAAQSKIHTRNSVGLSGKIYVGSMQGYADTSGYPGGYVMTYDPRTGEAVNLGIPQPGYGIIDVVADEGRGIIYVIPVDAMKPWTCYDMKTKLFREMGPLLTGRAHTLIDWRGYANAITRDYRLAQYNPDTGKVVVRDILVDGKRVTDLGISPEWAMAADGRTAYLIQAADPTLYEIDLLGEGKVVKAMSHGRLIEGKNPRSRTLRVGPDGRLYAVVRIKNETGFGEDKLYHLVRFDPKTKKMDDMGVLAVKNPGFFSHSADEVGRHTAISSTSPAYVGYHTLPDGTLTPGNSSDCMAMIVTRDGVIYVTILYPFTLLKIEGLSFPRTSSVLEPITIQD
jgi:hypothetical protein